MYTTLPCNRLLVGISGSIHAAQIMDYLVPLRREFAKEIRVIMSATATQMVSPRTVEQAIESPVMTDIWGTSDVRSPHVRLPAWAELFVVLPATANVLSKAANGAADDLLSTAIVASPQPVVFAPAMNPVMWRAQAVQRNVARLRADGHYVIDPAVGTSVTTGRLDAGMTPTPGLVFPHLWHVHLRRLRASYWAEATATPPQTPATTKSLPLLQIATARPQAANGKVANGKVANANTGPADDAAAGRIGSGPGRS